jgi:hypothetical protein
MSGYEQLGLFYLGKRFDVSSRTRLPEPLLYDSKDLLTHAMCVGMTGSGKTGLGITLIEEAAIDGVPVLAIDPKGDLSNLLLTFPSLAASDFAPWISASEAAAEGKPADVIAAERADTWKRGLAEWDQAPDRIARFRAAASVQVYTPGSRAARPLALLRTLGAPADNDEDAAAGLSSTAGSLLTLAGITEPGSHSRELTLLSTILASAPSGSSGGAADLAWLVQQIQRPSFDRIGVMDLETFFPARDRQELALRFNSVLAAPGFDVWLSGDPLDMGNLLYTPEGRPRVAVISIAHLDDSQRMMVVSMVMNAVLAWTRRQSGTSSLRAMVYMDEVFGYLPPVSNPASKLPILTLLKQARAFGVGVVLATQNPVDLDYKALSNMGTWFLGKLQTERDKARVLDGIEGLTSAMDRQALDAALSGLQRRVFLMHNVHESQPAMFETRWTLSYLRGPMSRDELKRAASLSQGVTPDANRPAASTPVVPQAAEAASSSGSPATTAPASPPQTAPAGTGRPILPAGIREVFLPGSGQRYTPVLYGAARVHYSDTKRGVDHTSAVQAMVPIGTGVLAVDWERAETTDVAPDALSDTPPAGELPFAQVPADALKPKSYDTWTRDFEQWLARARPLQLLTAPSLKITSQPGESERDFRIRLQQSMKEARDAAVDKLRAKYASRIQRLADKVRAAEDAVGREQEQAGQQKLQSAVSIGATVLGALLGRKVTSMSTLGRATTAARGVSRSMKESEDIARAQQRLAEARAELQKLEAEVEAETAKIAAASPDQVALEPIELKPKRGGVDVRLVSLAWRIE